MTLISNSSREMGSAVAQPETSSRKHRVLIVDDHPITRQGLRAVIAQQSDLEVCAEVGSAAEALEAFAKTRPDVAVIDIAMRPTNGMELTRQLKTQAPHLPVLMVSMHDE